MGDKIDVMTASGSKVVTGFVEEVSPMRTHLRTDHWLSVMVPNKVRPRRQAWNVSPQQLLDHPWVEAGIQTGCTLHRGA